MYLSGCIPRWYGKGNKSRHAAPVIRACSPIIWASHASLGDERDSKRAISSRPEGQSTSEYRAGWTDVYQGQPHHTRVQYSTVQYSTVQYSTVQYSTVQYSTVQYSTVQCSAVQYQYSTVQHSTVQYSTVQYSTVQYSTVPAHVCAWTGWHEGARHKVLDDGIMNNKS